MSEVIYLAAERAKARGTAVLVPGVELGAVEAVAELIQRDRPDLSAQACLTCARRFVEQEAAAARPDPLDPRSQHLRPKSRCSRLTIRSSRYSMTLRKRKQPSRPHTRPTTRPSAKWRGGMGVQ